MNTFSDITPIHTVFYTVFHPTEGTKICFEFPPNNLAKSKIKFDTIKNYIIPKPQLCNKLLTLKYEKFRIVGYPVNVRASYYARNSFNFNIVFVFPYDKATTPYEPSIERLGKMFAVLEEQSQILSKAERDLVYYQLKSDSSTCNESNKTLDSVTEKYHELIREVTNDKIKQLRISDILTKTFQDLNNYSECLIPIDSGNSIDIKLFSLNASPTASLSIEDVPITTVNLMSFVNSNWDPTMLKIVPFINGVNSISRIAKFSDSDITLVIECIKHLIYYDCVIIVDIFQFSNIYAPTNLLSTFLTDRVLATECQKYIISTDSAMTNLDFQKLGILHNKRPSYAKQNSTSSYGSLKKRVPSNSSGNSGQLIKNSHYNKKPLSNSSMSLNKSSSELADYEENDIIVLPTKTVIFDLYRSLSQGCTLKDWYKIKCVLIKNHRIDVRKFVVFGVTRGLIYRSISYPILKNSPNVLSTTASNIKFNIEKLKNKKNGNLFSTADIKPDIENVSDANKRKSFESSKGGSSALTNSNYKSIMTNGTNKNTDNIADELLKEVYQKLTIQEDPNKFQDQRTRGMLSSQKLNLYSMRSAESKASTVDRTRNRNSSSTIRSKVTFDTMINNEDAVSDNTSIFTNDNQKSQQKKEELLQKEILILLNCLRNADSMDRICTKLEKDREEVEAMLKSIGSYNMLSI